MPGRGVGTSVRQGRGGRTGSRGRGGRTGIIGGLLHPPTPVKLRSRSTGGASGATPLYVNSSAVKAAVESSGSSGSSTPTTSPSTVRQSLSRPNPNPVAQANGFEVYANQDAINAQRRSKCVLRAPLQTNATCAPRVCGLRTALRCCVRCPTFQPHKSQIFFFPFLYAPFFSLRLRFSFFFSGANAHMPVWMDLFCVLGGRADCSQHPKGLDLVEVSKLVRSRED